MSDATVGQSLAQAREARGLSVEDVAASTRIRGQLIRWIEADDYSHCGGDFYARGHIRSIAHVVGIDAEPLVAQYDKAHCGTPVPVAPTQPMDTDLSEPSASRRPNWRAAMVLVLVVVCAIAGVELALSSGSSNNNTASPPRPTRAATPLATPSSVGSTPATAPSNAVAAVPRDQVTVLIRVTGDTTWLSVKNAAGQALFEGLLRQGDTRTFADKTALHLVIGNAPAVQLVVNNHEIGAPPGQGNVARLTFTPADFASAAG